MKTTDTNRRGITLVELLVVLLIIGILSTIASNVYIQRVTLARVSAAKATISQLEAAIAAYQSDVGQLPPSGSGTVVADVVGATLDNDTFPAQGNGYLFLSLTRSLNGNMLAPLESRWRGPYIDIPESSVGTLAGTAPTNSTELPQLQILDPWGNPYVYVRHQDYDALGGTELPAESVLADAETHFNASGFQIISNGPNEVTLDPPERGLDADDIANFKNYFGGN